MTKNDHRPRPDCESCPINQQSRFCAVRESTPFAFDALGTSLTLTKQMELFRQGQSGQDVYIVCSGLMKVISTSAKGRQCITQVAGRGSVLGLSTALIQAPHAGTAVAVELTVLRHIRHSDLLSFIETHSEGALQLVRELASQVNAANGSTRRLALAGSVAERLASLLLGWTKERSQESDRIALNFTHEEMGAMIGTTRESVTRTMRAFQDQSLITINGYTLRVLSREGLEAIYSG